MDDYEAIRQLKARYCRFVDTKDWDGMRDQVFCDDVVMDTREAGGNLIEGAAAFLEFLAPTLADSQTVHQVHVPEIELLSDTTASAIWAMEDRIRWPDGSDMQGFGHYHETYRKTEGGWRIATSRLTRLRLDFTPAG